MTGRLETLVDSWTLSLDERNLSDRTLQIYQRTARALLDYLGEHGIPSDPDAIEPAHLRAFLAAEVHRTSAVSAHQHYRNLRVLFRWLVKEGERSEDNPMLRVDPPAVTTKIKPSLREEQLLALLKTCEGNGFEQRRDTAIIRVFIDTGVRVSGIANVRLADVTLRHHQMKVRLKGGDEHMIPLGKKAAAAVDRYLRIRSRHPRAEESPWLWLGMTGKDTAHLGTAGIQDMLERRGKLIGIDRLTPHWFRRTFAHDWLDGGGSMETGMMIAGWKTRAMFEHYAGELAQERAREAHARLSPGDRL